jgi:hypothetical protein
MVMLGTWTYLFRFLIKPTNFVVIWFAIFKLNGVGLNFGSPNFNLNYFVMMLIPKPSSNNTSSIVFFPICTWIIAIWLSIVIVVIPTYGVEENTCLFVVTLFKFWVVSSFSFCHTYLFNSRVILNNCPKFKL